jgi:hypothetical protein
MPVTFHASLFVVCVAHASFARRNVTCFVEIDKLADRSAPVRTRLSRLARVDTGMYLTMSRYLSRVFVRCQRGTRFVCIVLEEKPLKQSRLFRRFRVVYPHKIPLSNTKLSPITLAFHRSYLNGFASFRPAVTPRAPGPVGYLFPFHIIYGLKVKLYIAVLLLAS